MRIIHITPNALDIIEEAARNCYNSKMAETEEDQLKFLLKLKKNGHTSIFEHASATVEFNHVSRVFTHQIVRHRLASFCQESQRHVIPNSEHFIAPPKISQNQEAYDIFMDACGYMAIAYDKLLKLGFTKDDARFILPEATQSKIIVTANFREWMAIFEQRCSPKASWEIRTNCTKLRDELNKLYPIFI